MAAYPEFSVTDLARFSGRPTSEYTNASYVDTAISQAKLLFELATCLGGSWPDDLVSSQLASMAVLAVADAIYLAQPYQAVLSNPFSSETIGSYSYSKISGAVMSGVPTGITWFDLAVTKLGVCDISSGIPFGGGIEAFEHDGVFSEGALEGNSRLLGPADLNGWAAGPHDPSEGYPYAAD